MSNLLTLENVSKVYDEAKKPVHVLRELTHSFAKGSFTAIQGASGVGKSTLLNLLGFLDTANTGRILYHDIDMSKASDSYLSQVRNREIGFVFQFHHLLSDFTAWENILMPLQIRGVVSKKDRDLARELVSWVSMEHRLDHLPSELSGGERQRVALVRSLVHQPSLLLADEPSGNLDEENSGDLHRLLKEVNDSRGVTVIVATHDESLASLAESRLVLREGKLFPLIPAINT